MTDTGRFPIAAEKIHSSRKADTGFIISMILLCGLGLTALYSGSGNYAMKIFSDQLYFVKRQLLIMCMGLAALLVLSFIDLNIIRRFLPAVVLITLVMCVLPFLPVIGVEKNGAYRWIALGPFTFQPSELVKITMVVFLANLFAKKHDRLDEPMVSVIPAIVMLLLFVGIVYIQNDFSTSIFILLTGLLMFFVAGVKLRWFAGLVAVLLPLVVLFVFSKTYRVMRIISYINPSIDPQGASYQAVAAKEAIISGGFWGRGIGGGIRKISSVPEIQADFIFAGWAEEMGLFGVVGYFCLLAYFAWRGYSIAFKCRDRFRSYTAFGATSLILFQSLLNCGVVSGFLPATGIPLPFFSAGGSSIFITLCLCGLIINISRWESETEKLV